MKLSRKTSLFFGTFTLLAIISFLAVNYFTVERSLYDNARKELRHKVESVNSAIRRMLDSSIQNYLRAIVDQDFLVLKEYYARSQAGFISVRQARDLFQRYVSRHRIGKTGYVVAVRKTGKRIILDIHPHMRGQDCASNRGCQEWVAQKIGFNQYLWKNPDEQNYRWKVAYIKPFKPWNWVLGATCYKDELHSLVDIKDLKKLIEPFKVLKKGYFFILDENMNMLIHPEVQGRNVANVTNSRGIFVTREIMKHQGRFYRYHWRNPSENKA